MQCTQRLLPMCSIPPRMSRDGWAGSTAKIYLPGHGYYFFSGATFTPVGSNVVQNEQMYIGGVTKPNTYKKNGFWCS